MESMNTMKKMKPLPYLPVLDQVRRKIYEISQTQTPKIGLLKFDH